MSSSNTEKEMETNRCFQVFWTSVFTDMKKFIYAREKKEREFLYGYIDF